MPVGGVAEEKDVAYVHPRRYHPFERPAADQVHCRGEIRHAKHGAQSIKDMRIIADGGIVRREVDTPRGLKPDGFSGYAQGHPSRERLKGLPGPSGRYMHRQASSAQSTLAQAHGPRPRHVDAFTRGNDLPRNAETACSWQGAKCPTKHARTSERNRQNGRDYWLKPRSA
jgi:hypothetical protein